MLLSLGASIGAFHQRECSDCERLRRFGGFTRMKPPRGLSISAMRKNAIATTSPGGSALEGQAALEGQVLYLDITRS